MNELRPQHGPHHLRACRRYGLNPWSADALTRIGGCTYIGLFGDDNITNLANLGLIADHGSDTGTYTGYDHAAITARGEAVVDVLRAADKLDDLEQDALDTYAGDGALGRDPRIATARADLAAAEQRLATVERDRPMSGRTTHNGSDTQRWH